MCLNKTVNLEVLNSLQILTQKYSFFKLKQVDPQNVNVDLEKSYLLSSDFKSSKLLKSNICLLIGVNPRYEGTKLNLNLRSRYLQGNFNVIQIGSLINLTFSNTNIASNTKTLKSLAEGNSLFCQEFTNSLHPTMISNTELFKREDSFCLMNTLNFLSKHVNIFSQSNNRSRLNFLSSSVNDIGFMNFNHFKSIEKKDFKDSVGIYFVNNSFSTPNIKKLLNLKLLNVFYGYNHKNKMLITQSNNLDTKLTLQLKKSFKLNNHLHLPNTVSYETSGTYINTKGDVNKIIKVITPLGQTKSDWQIIRKILSYSKKMLYVTNFWKNKKLVYHSNTVYHFENYMGFQYYAISNINNLSFKFFKKITTYHLNSKRFKSKRKKFYNSQLRF